MGKKITKHAFQTTDDWRHTEIKFESLGEIVDFIKKEHQSIFSKFGIYCLRLFRQDDGTRIPFEETKGARIKSFDIFNDNTLIIHQYSHGTTAEHKIASFDARTYLPDVTMINVYDYSAEFFCRCGIDFVYLQQTQDAKVVMMAEWVNQVPRILRAQWFKDEETEKLLSGVGLAQKIRHHAPLRRNIILD